MKVVIAAFNQEKALVWAFSVFVKLHRLIVYSTNRHVTLVTGHVSRDSAADLEFPAVGACHVWAGGHVAPE